MKTQIRLVKLVMVRDNGIPYGLWKTFDLVK